MRAGAGALDRASALPRVAGWEPSACAKIRAVLGTLTAFLLVSVVVIVTPGPDTALTVRNALVGGRRGGVFTAGGVASGQTVWAFLASIGVVALLGASQPVFLLVRVLGAAYLACLGCGALLRALRRQPPVLVDSRAARGPITAAGAYGQGLLSNLGNPKMAVFFVSLLPQFTHGPAASLLLGLVFCALTFVWLTAYAIAAARAGDFLRHGRIRRLVDGLTGLVLVGLGLRLASGHR